MFDFSVRLCVHVKGIGVWLRDCVCVCVNPEGLIRWVCFRSALTYRSRTASVRWAHYHDDGRDGNAVAAALLAAAQH